MGPELLQVQWGKETTWGTPVAGAVKGMLISDFSLDPNLEVVKLKEKRGSVAPRFTSVPNYVAGAGSIEGALSYDDIPYWIEMLSGIATPSGAGPYVRAYTFPGVPVLTGGNGIRYSTFIWGETTNVYRMRGGLLSKLNIKASKGEPWMFSGDLLGMYVDNAGALAALSDRVTTPIAGSVTSIYVDAWAGTIGTTLVPATTFSFELDIDTKRILKQHLGSLNPDSFDHPEEWDATLTLEMEFNATSKPFVDEMIVANPIFQRQVRIKATTGANEIAQLDFAGDQDNAPKLWTDNDGVITVEIKLNGKYNPTLGAWMKASVTNQVAALA